MLSPATRTNTPCFSHCAPKYAPIPHSGGKGSLGDLLSVNSVPCSKPVPLISPIMGLSENTFRPSWNFGDILFTCSTIFLSL
uniref:Putative ovule protein n=1 Tax=Solanum chacoense TaxID=4108 RepID=A0A0V0H9E4_SOLCH